MDIQLLNQLKVYLGYCIKIRHRAGQSNNYIDHSMRSVYLKYLSGVGFVLKGN
jgi:hypothetical protein